MTTPNSDRFAFDRGTVRSIDADGRMHVAISNLSKATVNPYYGHEIPNAEVLGLDPDTVYQLLRDPVELEKAAPTFNNLQLLSAHVPVSAADPQKDIVVGSTGTDAAFHAPFLTNSLVVWDAESIKGIESRDQCELSCAYRYVADMTPGTYEGAAYDGRMTSIQGNHVALVQTGRAGPDVVVGDSQLKKESMKTKVPSIKAGVAKGALIAALTPLLAKDADLAGLVELIDALAPDVDPVAEPVADASPVEAILAMLKGKISDEDLAAVSEKLNALKLAADDLDPVEPKPALDVEPKPEPKDDDKKDEGISKKAMDAAISLATAATAKATEAAVIDRLRGVTEATEVVAPYVGKLAIACDSAEGVYKAALDTMGVNVTGVHPSAYRAVIEAHSKPGATPARRIAADSAQLTGMAARFPDAMRAI